MPSSPCPLAIERNGLKILREYLHLPVESSSSARADHDRDAIFVAIDFEHPQAIKESKLDAGSQLGVAILDTRDLKNGTPKKEIIKTHNYAIGPPSYQHKATERFLFGNSTPITSFQDMLSSLESLISPPPSPPPPGQGLGKSRRRDILLVGHGIGIELRALHRLGFDLSRTFIVGALDTARVFFEIRQLPRSSPTPTLASLLATLDCPFSQLHSAGNDANFTLRALLLLAVESYEHVGTAGFNRKLLKPEDRKRLRLLKGVANVPLPPARTVDFQRRRQRKIRRREKFEEKQRKVREREDSEGQLRVRAERAARRRADNTEMESRVEEPPLDIFDYVFPAGWETSGGQHG